MCTSSCPVAIAVAIAIVVDGGGVAAAAVVVGVVVVVVFAAAAATAAGRMLIMSSAIYARVHVAYPYKWASARKPVFGGLRTTKAQTSLRIHAV